MLRVEDDRTATVFYDLRRGLPAESFGIPFGHVCAGVFLAGLDVVARAHGFAVTEDLDHAEMDFTRLDRDASDHLHRLGRVTLRPHTVTADDREALARFTARRTSRRPYDATLVDASAVSAAVDIAAASGHRFRTTADRATVDEIVRVNQETLFDDLRNDAVHEEILHWLRFSKRQAAETGDGLSAETMLMPGPVLRFAMEHRGLWEAPGVGGLFKRAYLSTMRGVRQLGWLEGQLKKGPVAEGKEAAKPLSPRAEQILMGQMLAGHARPGYGDDGTQVYVLTDAVGRLVAAATVEDDEVSIRGPKGGEAGYEEHCDMLRSALGIEGPSYRI